MSVDTPALDDCNDPNFIRGSVSVWLTLALDDRTEGPTSFDLLQLRDWIDNGCVGPLPIPCF